MLYFIVFCQLYSVFSKDLEKKFENTIGLQQFSIKTLIKNPFPELQKIVITLTYLQNDYPILIMCPNKPSNTALNSYEMLLKEKCYADLNAFDEQNEIQLLSIQSQSTYKEFQKNYNIYVLSSQDLFIGAYSQQASTFKISAQIIKSYNCAKICQNQGNCIDGICQCLIGYFGDDCGIIGLNLLDQIVLSPIQFYYLDLSQVPGTTFLKILSKSTPISQQCYVDYPFINHGIQFVSNLIQLDQTRLDNCRNATLTFQLQMQINIMPYYVFKIFNDHEIQILMPDDSESTGSQEILLIIFTPLSFILLLLIFCCCYKFHKQNLMKEAAKNEKSQEKIPTYVDYYMPTQRYIKIKETEEQLYLEGQFCSICLEKFDALSLVKITYCKHIFHATCISQWLNKLKGCPLCRANLDEKNVAAMTPQKSMSLFDQITNKSSLDKNINLYKVPTLNSLTSINNNGQRNQQNIQRSLAYIEQ